MLLIGELLALILVLGAYFDAARRRTGQKRHGWPFVAIGLIGYLAVPQVAIALAGPRLGIWAAVLGWCWVFLTYGSIFVVLGGARKAKGSWLCPKCQVINDARTLVCGCGEPAPGS